MWLAGLPGWDPPLHYSLSSLHYLSILSLSLSIAQSTGSCERHDVIFRRRQVHGFSTLALRASVAAPLRCSSLHSPLRPGQVYLYTLPIFSFNCYLLRFISRILVQRFFFKMIFFLYLLWLILLCLLIHCFGLGARVFIFYFCLFFLGGKGDRVFVFSWNSQRGSHFNHWFLLYGWIFVLDCFDGWFLWSDLPLDCTWPENRSFDGSTGLMKMGNVVEGFWWIMMDLINSMLVSLVWFAWWIMLV